MLINSVAPLRASQSLTLEDVAAATPLGQASSGVALQSAGSLQDDAERAVVETTPANAVRRRMIAREDMALEIVQSTTRDRIEHNYRGERHLLVLCEQGARHEGETRIEGLPPSTLRNLGRKMSFVPAGRHYQEWQQPRTLIHLSYFYFDPARVQALSGSDADPAFMPRLHFEDRTLWDSAMKLKKLAERPLPEDRLYFDALAAVLAHELVRLNRGSLQREPQVRGGLAAWQQRVVTAYIEEHLAEPIPLSTLAQLARLSPHYFCRAFKQSFGLPPHRYHSIRRVERAKTLLAKSSYSVTEIGLRLGFSETSSFSTAFRKATGLTPTAYYRSLG
jgi:AraC-like DNA-binding protein